MKLNALGTFHYLSRGHVFFIAALGTFIILVYTEPKPLRVLLQHWQFYWAWFINSLMAGVVIGSTVYANRLLDSHYPWSRHYNNRLKQQLRYALLGPVLLSMAMVTLYFGLHGVNVLQTNYFSRILLIDVLFIIVLNFVLFLLYHRHHSKHIKAKQQEEKQVKASSLLLALHEVYYFYARDKFTWYVNEKGESFIWPHSLESTQQMANSKDFFLVRRGFLVSRKAIANVEKHKDSYLIQLHTPPHLCASQQIRETTFLHLVASARAALANKPEPLKGSSRPRYFPSNFGGSQQKK